MSFDNVIRSFVQRGQAAQVAVDSIIASSVAKPEPLETLVACPVCGQRGFSPRGLVAHRGKKSCQRRRKERGR